MVWMYNLLAVRRQTGAVVSKQQASVVYHVLRDGWPFKSFAVPSALCRACFAHVWRSVWL
jgi:hypothetical protein